MAEKLTSLMERLLVALAELREEGESVVPPAKIAMQMGIRRGPRRQKGPWSGYQNPAQYIIAPLGGLERRGLIVSRPRRDGLSGSAYALTERGREHVG